MERNKENLRLCQSLARSLEVCKFYDRLSPDGIATIAGTLLGQCRTPDQAESVIQDWILENEEVPTPAAIARIARGMNRESNALPPACSQCYEIPGYQLTTVVLKSGLHAGETRSALTLCSCARGQKLGEAAAKYAKSDAQVRQGESEGGS